jgi:dephospho-CoA kinase
MKHPDRPLLVALTGGIASGKTVVAKWFEEQQLKVFYADKIGHALFQEQYIINNIKEIFGNKIVLNNTVDRNKLGEIVFNSELKRKQLNELLHPEILKKIFQIIRSSTEKILIFEIPLLFENDLQDSFDLTVNISVGKELQIQRIMKRDKISKIAAEKRIDSQMSDIDKQELADINLVNDAGFSDLISHLHELYEYILRLKKKKNIKQLLN